MASEKESVVFNGITYSRNPASGHRSARVYYTAYADGKRLRGVGQLHTEVWKAAHGASGVPRGCVIHHVDFDPLNNDPSNLQCVTRLEHSRIHPGDFDRGSAEWLAHLDAIRGLAVDWHRSDEGRTWHSQQATASYANREARTSACEACGKTYSTRHAGESRHCSRACNRRMSDRADRYRVPAECPVCGAGFMQSKYRPVPATCSNSCGAHLRARRKAAGL